MQLHLSDPWAHRAHIEIGLNAINLHYPEPPITIDRIERACCEKRAFFFIGARAGEFVVLVPQHDLSTDARSILVWLAYSPYGDAVETYQPDIDELARSIGATRIDFMTARAGFERKARRAGYRKTLTTYSKEVPA